MEGLDFDFVKLKKKKKKKKKKEKVEKRTNDCNGNRTEGGKDNKAGDDKDGKKDGKKDGFHSIFVNFRNAIFRHTSLILGSSPQNSTLKSLITEAITIFSSQEREQI